MNKTLHTKYGNAKPNNKGYYQITSTKEGNHKKLLHRLIAADYFGDWINDPKDFFDIHHIDNNPLNNCVLNLEPIPSKEHISMHKKDKKRPEKEKIKISNAMSNSGFFRVIKIKDKKCKQGFMWRYTYYDEEEGKPKSISRVNIEELEKEVKSRGLKWKKFEDGE